MVERVLEVAVDAVGSKAAEKKLDDTFELPAPLPDPTAPVSPPCLLPDFGNPAAEDRRDLPIVYTDQTDQTDQTDHDGENDEDQERARAGKVQMNSMTGGGLSGCSIENGRSVEKGLSGGQLLVSTTADGSGTVSPCESPLSLPTPPVRSHSFTHIDDCLDDGGGAAGAKQTSSSLDALLGGFKDVQAPAPPFSRTQDKLAIDGRFSDDGIIDESSGVDAATASGVEKSSTALSALQLRSLVHQENESIYELPLSSPLWRNVLPVNMQRLLQSCEVPRPLRLKADAAALLDGYGFLNERERLIPSIIASVCAKIETYNSRVYERLDSVRSSTLTDGSHSGRTYVLKNFHYLSETPFLFRYLYWTEGGVRERPPPSKYCAPLNVPRTKQALAAAEDDSYHNEMPELCSRAMESKDKDKDKDKDEDKDKERPHGSGGSLVRDVSGLKKAITSVQSNSSQSNSPSASRIESNAPGRRDDNRSKLSWVSRLCYNPVTFEANHAATLFQAIELAHFETYVLSRPMVRIITDLEKGQATALYTGPIDLDCKILRLRIALLTHYPSLNFLFFRDALARALLCNPHYKRSTAPLLDSQLARDKVTQISNDSEGALYKLQIETGSVGCKAIQEKRRLGRMAREIGLSRTHTRTGKMTRLMHSVLTQPESEDHTSRSELSRRLAERLLYEDSDVDRASRSAESDERCGEERCGESNKRIHRLIVLFGGRDQLAIDLLPWKWLAHLVDTDSIIRESVESMTTGFEDCITNNRRTQDRLALSRERLQSQARSKQAFGLRDEGREVPAEDLPEFTGFGLSARDIEDACYDCRQWIEKIGKDDVVDESLRTRIQECPLCTATRFISQHDCPAKKSNVRSGQSQAYSFLIIEYPGYGLSEGTTNKDAIIQHSVNSILTAMRNLGSDVEVRLQLLGFSLGSAVAATVAGVLQRLIADDSMDEFFSLSNLRSIYTYKESNTKDAKVVTARPSLPPRFVSKVSDSNRTGKGQSQRAAFQRRVSQVRADGKSGLTADRILSDQRTGTESDSYESSVGDKCNAREVKNAGVKSGAEQRDLVDSSGFEKEGKPAVVLLDALVLLAPFSRIMAVAKSLPLFGDFISVLPSPSDIDWDTERELMRFPRKADSDSHPHTDRATRLLIAHGTEDPLINVDHSRRLWKTLRESARSPFDEFALLEVHGEDHSSINSRDDLLQYITRHYLRA